MLIMAVARFFSGGVVTRYVLVFPVLWMTSYLHISSKLRLLDVAARLRQ